MEVDELDARLLQDVPDLFGMVAKIGLSHHEGRLAFTVEHGQPAPAPHPHQLGHQELHTLKDRAIAAPTVQPLAEEQFELGMPGEIEAGVNAGGVEGHFDLLPLLLGDHRQGAVGLAADLLAQVAIPNGADHADQQGENEQGEHETQPLGAVAPGRFRGNPGRLEAGFLYHWTLITECKRGRGFKRRCRCL